MSLTKQKCVPCEGGVPPLTQDEARKLLREVPQWTLGEKSITREFKFPSFRDAIAFINRIADVADGEGHHPDIHNYFKRVQLEITTHAINGLSNNDFILAAKIDQVAGEGR